MKSPLFLFFAALLVSACAETALDESFQTSVALTGDMLFEGSNTLQAAADINTESVARDVGTTTEKLKKIGVSEAVLTLDENAGSITESLLLQIVSDKNSLATVGTLSPVTGAGSLKLNLSESIDLLPYLRDEGTTWVLDLNISEDYMDEMTVKATLIFRTEYKD